MSSFRTALIFPISRWIHPVIGYIVSQDRPSLNRGGRYISEYHMSAPRINHMTTKEENITNKEPIYDRWLKAKKNEYGGLNLSKESPNPADIGCSRTADYSRQYKITTLARMLSKESTAILQVFEWGQLRLHWCWTSRNPTIYASDALTISRMSDHVDCHNRRSIARRKDQLVILKMEKPPHQNQPCWCQPASNASLIDRHEYILNDQICRKMKTGT